MALLGLAWLGMCTLLRCPLKILDAFPFCSTPKIGSCVLCAPATCVCEYLLKWIEHLTHTPLEYRVTIILFHRIYRIPSRRVFFLFLSFFALVTPASEVQTSVCRLLGSLHGILYIFSYTVRNRQFIPMFQFRGDLLFGMANRSCGVHCIRNTLCAQYVCLCKIVCVFVLICRKVNHRLWKHGCRIYNAIIEGAVAFWVRTNSQKLMYVAKGAMLFSNIWLRYSWTVTVCLYIYTK